MQTREPSDAWKEIADRQMESAKMMRRIIRFRKWLCRWPVKAPKLEVISSVREPIGLCLSSIFQNHALLFPGLELATPEACRAELLRPKALKDIQNWFDIEVKEMFGIDVYATAFPHAQGYAIYENHFVRLLVFRYEAIDRLPGMLREFLHCEVPAVVNRNIGSSKAYGAAYEAVRKTLRMPVDFVTTQCNSKLMQHFYSQAERRQFIERWAEELTTNKAAVVA